VRRDSLTVTVYVRTPSCGSTTNPSARASDRICQICFASAFAAVREKLTLLKPENEYQCVLSFVSGAVLLLDNRKSLEQPSDSTSIRGSVFDMALLTSPRQNISRYCCPSRWDEYRNH
jgi:hypothetical protein